MARDTRTRTQRILSWANSARDAVGVFVDSCVYAFNPTAGAQRIIIRKIVSESERRMSSRHDDRDRGDHNDRLQGDQRWMGSRLSPDSELEKDLETRRQRSLELYRDTTAGGAIDTKVDHVIGKGFTYRPKIVEQPGISKDAADGWNTQLLGVHNRWSRRCDLTGRKSLWELSRIAHRSFSYAGETFTIMWAKKRKGQPIPLVLEVIDVDRVCTPPEKAGDPNCRMGIQYDSDGEILGYWVRTTNPYDTKQVAFKWFFVESDRMLHVFEQWFPGQSRGYPWMQRTLERHRDGEDLDEAGIIAAQVEACNAAFIKTKQPLKAAQTAGRGGPTIASNRRLQDIRPGTINYLDDDSEEIYFNTPTKSNIVGTLHEWNYRRIAAGLDWPFEFLMKKWDGISFAGGRLILSGAKIKCGVEQQLFMVAWFSVIADEVVEESVMFGVVDINVSAYQQRPWVYQAHRWTPPMWSYALNPGEEIDAKIAAVENNQRTLESVLGENGDELDEVLAQRERECRAEESKDILPAARLAALGQLGSGGESPDGETPSPASGKKSKATKKGNSDAKV